MKNITKFLQTLLCLCSALKSRVEMTSLFFLLAKRLSHSWVPQHLLFIHIVDLVRLFSSTFIVSLRDTTTLKA